MAGNPFDFNRDGHWSSSERAFTHYGVDPLMRGGGEGRDGCGGCGCAMVLLALPIIFVLFRLFLS